MRRVNCGFQVLVAGPKYSVDDEPFDEEFGRPYFGLYGVGDDGKLEHIADRKTYSEAVRLAEKLAPGVAFPNSPTFVSRPCTLTGFKKQTAAGRAC